MERPRTKLSVHVDSAVLAAAGKRVGTDQPTEVINAALALLASPDPFVRYFLTTADRLPEDFDVAV